MISKEPLLNFKKEVDVVACYLEHDGKIVLLYRQAHKHNGNTFGLPAGKVDPGENIEQAVVREVKEETGLNLLQSEVKYIDSMFVRDKDHDIMYHTFVAHFSNTPDIQINPNEHQKYIWTTPAEALKLNLIHDLADCIKSHYRI